MDADFLEIINKVALEYPTTSILTTAYLPLTYIA